MDVMYPISSVRLSTGISTLGVVITKSKFLDLISVIRRRYAYDVAGKVVFHVILLWSSTPPSWSVVAGLPRVPFLLGLVLSTPRQRKRLLNNLLHVAAG